MEERPADIEGSCEYIKSRAVRQETRSLLRFSKRDIPKYFKSSTFYTIPEVR
jgi:hypothetical protein